MKKLFVLLVLLAPLTVNASLIQLTGNFDGAKLGTASAVDQISGSWSLTFDDAGIAPAGVVSIDVALTAFSFDPNPLGGTTFDLTNTRARIDFLNSAIVFVIIGRPGVASISANADDFSAIYDAATLIGLGWSLASEARPSSPNKRAWWRLYRQLCCSVTRTLNPSDAWAWLGWAGLREKA